MPLTHDVKGMSGHWRLNTIISKPFLPPLFELNIYRVPIHLRLAQRSLLSDCPARYGPGGY